MADGRRKRRKTNYRQTGRPEEAEFTADGVGGRCGKYGGLQAVEADISADGRRKSLRLRQTAGGRV